VWSDIPFPRPRAPGKRGWRHFITADSPGQDFFLARFGVEIPGIATVHDRYGSWPIHRTDVEGDCSIGFFYQTVHFLIFLGEIGVALGVFGSVTRVDDLLSVRTENIEEDLFVVAVDSRE